MLASENRAEDLRPWAIIIVKEPIKPHDVFESMPASINPICPTDE